MTNDKYCVHCYPTNENHRQDKFESFFQLFFTYFLRKFFIFFPKKYIWLIGKIIQKIVLWISQNIKHAVLTDTIDRTQFSNGILVMWDEAKKRGLNIFNVNFGNPTQHFGLVLNKKKYYFDRNPIYLVNQKLHRFADAKQYDDKSFFKKVLLRHRLPCPIGRSFISSNHAFNYGVKLGFPLVVKPSISSLSRHVSFNIQSHQALQTAINIAKQVSCHVVVEQYIPGDVHRVIVLGESIIACAKRQPSKIIGNGKDMIEKLIDEKNHHPWRGDQGRRDYTLFKIEKNQHLENLLAEQGVSLKTKLAKNHEIFLSKKMNAGNGADIINVTELVHPENEQLFIKVHQILNLPLSGLDFICQDVSIPWQKQPFAIIENNSLPYVDMHHYPSAGNPINVASKVWDFVLATLLR